MTECLSPTYLVASLTVDFYTCLVEATSTKYTVNQVNNIIFQILTDACRMSSLFVGEIYKAIVNLDFKDQLEFMGNNLKLVTRFIKMFRVLNRYSEICFSVLNFFGDSVRNKPALLAYISLPIICFY